MASVTALSNRSPFARLSDLLFPIGIIGSVLVIMVPMPTPVMDLLLASTSAWQ